MLDTGGAVRAATAALEFKMRHDIMRCRHRPGGWTLMPDTAPFTHLRGLHIATMLAMFKERRPGADSSQSWNKMYAFHGEHQACCGAVNE